jgi:hypothetical protein
LLGIFEWGLGVICFHLEKPSLWQRRGGFLLGVGWCDEKQIPPPPPFKKGEKKHLIFLTVNDETRPLEIPNKPPFLKGGLGEICFHLEKPSLWQHRGGFFMCYNVKKFQFQENINGYSDI